jgi:hypothetical protein
MRDTAEDPIAGHLARLLLLIEALSAEGGHVRAMSALARHDFLLRYPVILARVLAAQGVLMPADLSVRVIEQHAIDSTMLRYKYGVWDHRYYPLIGRLVAAEFIALDRMTAPIQFRLSDGGAAAAAEFAGPSWTLLRGRSRLLAEHLHVTGYQLGQLINQAIAV